MNGVAEHKKLSLFIWNIITNLLYNGCAVIILKTRVFPCMSCFNRRKIPLWNVAMVTRNTRTHRNIFYTEWNLTNVQLKITIAYRSSRANQKYNSKQNLWKECRLNLLRKFFFSIITMQCSNLWKSYNLIMFLSIIIEM